MTEDRIYADGIVRFGECLTVMETMDDWSVDMILCDLPYGTTKCKWDVVIPFAEMWEQFNRVAKPKAAIVLTASQPFTSVLVMSNLKQFRYEWILDKGKGSNPLLSKKQPMKSHENIVVFSKEPTYYYPQMTEGKPYTVPRTGGNRTNQITGAKDREGFKQSTDSSKRYPLSIQKHSIHCGSKLHPSQKPQALFEYLIQTYTLPGELVFDACVGSGTTALAARATGRRFDVIEKEREYYNMTNERLNT